MDDGAGSTSRWLGGWSGSPAEPFRVALDSSRRVIETRAARLPRHGGLVVTYTDDTAQQRVAEQALEAANENRRGAAGARAPPNS